MRTAALLLALALAASAESRWDRATVELFARLPVQDGGRVKPLSTFAGFTLLALNGRRSCTTAEGKRLDPTEWVMDCLFFPEEAMEYPCFLVPDAGALDDLGLAHEGRSRRDRYSYADLLPARERLLELAGRYEHVDAKKRNAVQGQIVNLAHNLMLFESVAGALASLQPPPESAAVARVFGAGARPSCSAAISRAAELRPSLASDPDLRRWAESVAASPGGIALIPPAAAAPAGAEWLTPGAAAAEALLGNMDPRDAAAALGDLEAMVAARRDGAAFAARAEDFRRRVVTAAERRGEYAKIPLEVAFYRARFFHYAQIVYVLAFLVAAFGWIRPTRVAPRAAAGAVALATALLVAGIAMRCVIRGRPPVSTLYETILFVTAVAALAALAAEWLHRQGIALALAAVLGAGGMFLADRYEAREAVDTMPSLVAVLDTNFWLASHVTTITIGYAAGLLAGAVGHVTILGRLFGARRHDPAFYPSLASMTYGMTCFGLLFSVVGTVLGGIWANESWGRFWGWDPKENGALAIVLWQLIVLHARKGGYIRDFGLAMASVFGAVVVAASWWGVNLLGVGLHSYGFTSGIMLTLLSCFGIEALVLSAGAVAWALGRANERGAGGRGPAPADLRSAVPRNPEAGR